MIFRGVGKEIRGEAEGQGALVAMKPKRGPAQDGFGFEVTSSAHLMKARRLPREEIRHSTAWTQGGGLGGAGKPSPLERKCPHWRSKAPRHGRMEGFAEEDHLSSSSPPGAGLPCQGLQS